MSQTTEQDYLKQYDSKQFPSVLVTVDTVLLSFDDNAIKVLLVKRANHPEMGKWGLPGGFLNTEGDTSLEVAASRSVVAKTGVAPSYLEQVETVGGVGRDPRGWSVSVLFSALMPMQHSEANTESVSDTQWFAIQDIESLDMAFDHRALVGKALDRYRQKALYSFVPAYGLTQPFSLAELRGAHELLIGKELQRKTFLRRVESSGVLEEVLEVRKVRGKPAKLYRTTPAIDGYTFERNIEC